MEGAIVLQLADLFPAIEIRRSVALGFPRISDEIDFGLRAHLKEVARDYEAVAAIISFPAQDHDSARRQIWKTPLYEFGDAAAGVFHQREARRAIARCRQPIDFLHFRCSQDLHEWLSVRQRAWPKRCQDPFRYAPFDCLSALMIE